MPMHAQEMKAWRASIHSPNFLREERNSKRRAAYADRKHEREMTAMEVKFQEGQKMVDGDTPFMPQEKVHRRRDRMAALRRLKPGARLVFTMNKWGDCDYWKVVKVDRETGEVTIKWNDTLPGM